MNTVITGVPGSGKTTFEARRVVEWQGGVFQLDGHDSLTPMELPYLHGDVLVDDFSRTDRVLKYRWLEPSSHPDPMTRHMENEATIRDFAEAACRRRELEFHKMPLLEEWMMSSLWLFLEQPLPLPMRVLPFAFQPKHPVFKQMVEHCTNAEIAWKFKELTYLSQSQLRGEVGAAQRIANNLCRNPAFLARCDGDFDFCKFVDRGGKLLITWGDGSVSRDAARTMSLILLQKLYRYARTRKSPDPGILVVLEEALGADLIGKPEIRAMAELRKRGIHIDVLTQTLDYPPELVGGLLGNAQCYRSFRAASPDMAATGAANLATLLLDPQKIHHTETRSRQIHAGHKEVKVAGRKVLVPEYMEVSESFDRYESLSDQIKLFQSELMRLGVGWSFVRDEHGVRKEYCKPLESWLWPGLDEKKAQEKIALIYQRPEYQPGTIGEFVLPRKSAKNGTDNSTNGSTSRARFQKRSTSSKGRTNGRTRKSPGSSNGRNSSSSGSHDSPESKDNS